MWDEVADGEDDDEVNNSVSQVWVKATLCTEELFLSTQYIYLQYLSPHIRKVNHEGGGGNRWSTQHIYAGPAGFHTYQPDIFGLQGFQ